MVEQDVGKRCCDDSVAPEKPCDHGEFWRDFYELAKRPMTRRVRHWVVPHLTSQKAPGHRLGM